MNGLSDALVAEVSILICSLSARSGAASVLCGSSEMIRYLWVESVPCAKSRRASPIKMAVLQWHSLGNAHRLSLYRRTVLIDS